MKSKMSFPIRRKILLALLLALTTVVSLIMFTMARFFHEDKQAYIKDPRAGSFRQLVMAAEACPADIIHPGTPLNPKEKDLAKWIKRAEPYN